ncbi:MAG: ATP synthase F1 subunit gamma [Candidatus Wallbacteria bacterium HGW-Wallbacteria-1]|jgi:F-type H+-transporting ATPase subunit gamma|uniref:ATP synthase gamma chain n=1 Tax=Candidatus Wallbacteria bacterium HGW-Wallbacteria-1 TaxID=2013854 RepID=A0A2N1PSM0_9BACT|nr:MAG: ATP synthase F1 subunit gamma [Candidatus Wallbacteria bacterium HGW-Wallbacteria-1]
MLNLKDIKRKIKSISNTQQITRAMQMVAGAKLYKAERRVAGIRDFHDSVEAILDNHLCRLFADRVELLQKRSEIRRTCLIMITADKGLCGSFNQNLIREAMRIRNEAIARGGEISFMVVGRKGRDALVKAGVEPLKSYVDLEHSDATEIAESFTDLAVKGFLDGTFDAIDVLSTRYVSKVTFTVETTRMLPVSREASEARPDIYIYEPGKVQALEYLVMKSIDVTLIRLMYESLTSEFSSRMISMKGATDNAGELIRNLTLEKNRVRQASITQELTEISSGAEALK